MNTTAETLLHPVRLRIVLALGSDRLTTGEIARRLPEVAHATLYRHVAALVDAGVMEVVEERRVRGGIERTYALVPARSSLGAEEASKASTEDLLSGFVVFASSLVEALDRYLKDPAARPGEDTMGYRQAAIWLDEGERSELVERLRAAIGPFLANTPSTDRQRVLLNTILIPDLAADHGDDDEAR